MTSRTSSLMNSQPLWRSLFAGVCLLLSPVMHAQSVAPERIITYSTNPQYPPYHWSVDNKQFEGASIELLSLVMPPGIQLRPEVYPWKRSMLLTKEGAIDLLVSLRITPERSEYLTFTTHRAFPNPIVVFVRKDHSIPFKTREDLKGFKGGIALGDTFGGGFDEYWPRELQMEVAPTMVENFKKLEARRIDYFVTSYYLGLAYLARTGMDKDIAALSPPITDMDIHFGFSKHSNTGDLIDYVSKRLEELDREHVPEQLLKKHLQRFKENKSATDLFKR